MGIPIKEEANIPPTSVYPANVTFADPVVDNTVAHIHAPKCEDELDEVDDGCSLA